MNVEIYGNFNKGYCREDNCNGGSDVKIIIGSLELYLCNVHMLELYKELDSMPYVIHYNLVT